MFSIISYVVNVVRVINQKIRIILMIVFYYIVSYV